HQVNRGFSGFPTLGSNDDYAVGTARSVYGRSRRILQDIHTSDVVRVEIAERVTAVRPVAAAAARASRSARQGNAIHHKQGVVARADRRVASDAYSSGTPGLSRVIDDHHPGGTPLHQLVGAHDHAFVEVLGANRGNRSGQVSLARGSVADDHHFVEVFTPRNQGEVGHAHGTGNRDPLRGFLEADVRYRYGVGPVGYAGEHIGALVVRTRYAA